MSLARLRAKGWGPWLLLVGALIAATALRWSLLRAGPDGEVDAYSHYLVGRHLLAGGWRNVGVHWVWLPAWHGVTAAVALVGGDVETLRRLNVALSLAPPVLLAWWLRRGAMREPLFAPLAGALLALWPLGLWVGAAAQPEVCFQLGTLAACALWDARRALWAGAVLAALVLLRYEAWALPFAFLFVWARGERRPRDAAAWVLPGLAIVAWVLAHRAQTGEWLRFVRLNHEYIRPAFLHGSLAWSEGQGIAGRLGWYAVHVPAADARWLTVFALPGLAWWLPKASPVQRAAFVALLGFVTLSWVRRENWGLSRHFFVLAPWYAAGAAAAIVELARVATRGRFVGAGAALVAGAALGFTLPPRVREMKRALAAAFAHERLAADAVRRHAGATGAVFCMQNTIEAMSGVPHANVWRWHPAHVTAGVLRREARVHGVAVAVLPPEHAERLAGAGVEVARDERYVVLLVR